MKRERQATRSCDDGNATAPTARVKTGLPEAAQRALREAEERRRHSAIQAGDVPVEVNGRKGPDPVRYGDWEKGGIAVDF